MPSKSKDAQEDYIILESKQDSLLKDTTLKEKLQVFSVSQRISKYLQGLMFATGAISILVSVEYLLGADLLLAFEMRALFLAILAFIGSVNMVCGLLLLAKD